MRTVIVNAAVILPDRVIPRGGLVVEEGRILHLFEGRAPAAVPGDRTIDAKGLYVSPGFVDIHTHGAGNADFMDGSVEAVKTVCRTHLGFGTTSIVPSTLTSTNEELFANLAHIESAAKTAEGMPEILGVHLEGPYFSPEQKGAQDPRYLRNPDPGEYARLLEACPSIVRWTVAPELPGALEMGRWLRKKRIVASIGHSNAVFEEVERACANGYTLVTHLFNGMSRLVRKKAIMYLGVAESALLLEELDVEIIADGKHLPPSLLKLIYKCKGPDKICLITDSIRAAGLDVKESVLGSLANGQRVEIEDGVAYMPDRSSFGGSIATSNRLVRTMAQQAAVPLPEAVRMMSLTPARVMGVSDRKGSLERGKEADIVAFDGDIDVRLVMTRGRIQVDRL